PAAPPPRAERERTRPTPPARRSRPWRCWRTGARPRTTPLGWRARTPAPRPAAAAPTPPAPGTPPARSLALRRGVSRQLLPLGKCPQELPERGPQVVSLQRQLHRRPQVVELVAHVEAAVDERKPV